MNDSALIRLAAFTDAPGGGNPAGVWIGTALPDPDRMQAIAADLGYSETAFVVPDHGDQRTLRYWSPLAEVSFCGHATIAAAIALGRRHGTGRYVFDTRAGSVPVEVGLRDSRLVATLESVATRHEHANDALIDAALGALRWSRGDLDPSIPPARAFAGAWHLVFAVRTRQRLDELDYDFERLKALMHADGLTTLQLVWRERDDCIHARNPFPVGGVVEDPATGAAAAALGGYLRDAGLIAAPTDFQIRQGEAMGRPSLLSVHVPASGGIRVTGTATDIDPEMDTQP